MTLPTDDGPVLFYERRFYCFSNFSSFTVEWHGRFWMTAEHAYQAAKFTTPLKQDVIQTSRSAHDAKIRARKLQIFVRPDWSDMKLGVMEDILRAKLAQHSFVRKRLLESGDREIIEDSHQDAFWGWGPDRMGLNHLGRLWMKLRMESRA